MYVVEPQKKVWARNNRCTGHSMRLKAKKSTSPSRVHESAIDIGEELSDRAPPFYAKNPRFSISGVRYPPLRQLKKLQLPPPPWNLAVYELLEVDTKVNVPIGRIDPAESTLPLFCFTS